MHTWAKKDNTIASKMAAYCPQDTSRVYPLFAKPVTSRTCYPIRKNRAVPINFLQIEDFISSIVTGAANTEQAKDKSVLCCLLGTIVVCFLQKV